MKQVVRSFAIGLFLASIISFVSYKYIAEPRLSTHDLTAEELIEKVEEMNYKVISDEDYILYSVAKDEAENEETKKKQDKETDKKDKKDEKKDKDEKDKDEKDKDDKVQYTLKIKQGMLANDIADILEANGIVEDANKLAQYINDNGYGPFLQLGDFKLNNEMTHNEIAEVITKGRKN